MIRRVAALLVLLSALPASAGEIALWHSYRGDEQSALRQLVRRWNESHPQSPARPLAVPHDAYANKLTSAIPRGQGPDLFIFAHERVGDWARSGLIHDLRGDIEPRELERLSPGSAEALEIDGALYGLPLAIKSLALFYNTELVGDPPQTTDEMIAVAERCSDAEAGRYGLVYQAGDFYFHIPWLLGFGGRIFDDEEEPVLDDPRNALSLEFVSRLVDRGLVPEEQTAALVSRLFNEGRAAMAINGPWFIGELDAETPWELAPLPLVSETGRPARPFLTVEAAIVSAEARDPESALELARFLAFGEGARLRAEKAGQLVCDERFYLDRNEREIPAALRVFRRQAQRAAPMPNHPLMRSVWEPASRALRSVLRGAREPREALERAQHDLRVVTREPPQSRDPLPYLLAAGGILLALLFFWLRRRRRRAALGSIVASRHAYLYVAPAALAMLALVMLPFAVGTAVAFCSHRGGEFSFVGLANFVDILTSRDYAVGDPLSFWFTLGVTVLWTALNVLLHVSIGLALAMVLRSPWLRLRGVYRVLLIVPWAVPNYITALIWKGMFHSQFGAINGLLELLGLEPVSWFSSFWTALAANVTTNTWLGFPFMMVVCLGALQAIPRDLEEAAEMDGAGGWTRFWRVVLPQIKPALVPAVILGSVWTFNMFNIVYLVSGGEPDGATEILISEAYRWAFSRQEQYGYAAAYAVLIFVALFGYSIFTRRVTEGANAG
jgi:arabinogalactan oligomer / maltooligosaccharide transport system permease protein